MIDLDAVRSLRTVAREGSVSAAAAALGFTPSAVSQQIKRLERETGVTLLERVGRGVALTDAGTHLVVGRRRSSPSSRSCAPTCRPRLAPRRGRRRPARRRLLDGGAGHARAPAGRPRRRASDLRLLVRESERGRPSRSWPLASATSESRTSGAEWPSRSPTTSSSRPVHRRRRLIVQRSHRLATREVVHPADLADEAWVATSRPPSAGVAPRLFDGIAMHPVWSSNRWNSRTTSNSRAPGPSWHWCRGSARGPRRRPGGDPHRAPASTRDVVAVHRRSQADSPALRVALEALIAAGRDHAR